VEPPESPVDDLGVADLLAFVAERAATTLNVAAAVVWQVDDAGAVLTGGTGGAGAGRARDLFAVAGEGPGTVCARTAGPVVEPDMGEASASWPGFAPTAVAAGFRAAHAVPLCHGGRVIGVLCLLAAEPGALSDAGAVTAQALGDLAAVAIVQHGAATDARARNAQLQAALDSRVAIERATGVIAAGAGVDMAEAFARLRAHARANRRRLADVAQGIIDGSLSPKVFR